jgi:hypothetical protein
VPLYPRGIANLATKPAGFRCELAYTVTRPADAAMSTVADSLLDVLVQAGVRRIYGLVGDSLNAFSDAVRRSGERPTAASTGCTSIMTRNRLVGP